MNTFIAAGLLALVTQGGTDSTATKPISLNFSQTDVSQIFRAIGMRTNMNIIFASAEKIQVTLHFTADNADEAIRATAAAAGLVYRQVGKFYVVSKPGGLRQALIPFAEKERIKTVDAVGVAKLVGDLLPDVTVTAGEGEIVVVGVLYDLKMAEKIVGERPEPQKDPRVLDVVPIKSAPPARIAPVLAELFPGVKVSVLNDILGYGSIMLLGNPDDVAQARKRALDLDSVSGTATAAGVVETYEVKYVSAYTIAEFLRQVTPGVTVTVGLSAVIPSVPNAGTGSNIGTIKASGSTGSSGSAGLGPGPAGNGADTSAGTGATGGASIGVGNLPIGGSSEGVSNPPTRVLLRGTKEDVRLALQFLAKVDIRPRQVSVEVRVVDASPSELSRRGITYTWDPLKFWDISPGSPVTKTTDTTKSAGLSQISRLPVSLNGVLDMMVSHSDAKLLANPSIQVVDNQEADFFIGDELSFPITSGGALGTQNTTIEKFQVGVALNVRPRISPDGNVVMNINPIVQTLRGITNGLPQTASREARTTVVVRDGETVVIGGLIRDEDSRIVEVVPFLSKLPLVGQLFRHSSRDHRKSNVIVTITPHIIPDTEIPK